MGPPGLQGPKGETGIQGPSGQNGESGATGTPGMMSYKNWKECAWKDVNDDKDHGLIKVSYFCTMQMFVCHERGTKKKSRSPTGFGAMTSQIPLGRCNH